MEKNRANSVKSNKSMSDTDSQFDSFHSPLRSMSPLGSDEPEPRPETSPARSQPKAIVAIGKCYSPARSLNNFEKQKLESVNAPAGKAPPPPPPEVFYGRSVKENAVPTVTKVERPPGGQSDYDSGVEDGVGGERTSRAAVDAILRRSKREPMVKKAELGIRVCEMVLCLISFSVMAADKTQGWSGDSFDRYKEYRYCLAVTVIGFVYSGFQACDLATSLISGKHLIFFPFRRYHFNFAMDQILSYLLISASSSAATRVDDWVSNWGKDEFTEMASASVGMSFLAFAAFALSSLISGYFLCNSRTT